MCRYGWAEDCDYKCMRRSVETSQTTNYLCVCVCADVVDEMSAMYNFVYCSVNIDDTYYTYIWKGLQAVGVK